MGTIKGWQINLKAVYGKIWKDRAGFRLTEDMYESPDGKIGALLYGIGEVGVSKEIGRLAVFRHKEKPELIHNLPQLTCWYLYDSAVQYGKENLLFAHGFKSRKNYHDVEPLVLDPAANRFAAITLLPKNFYRIRHVEGMTYSFKEMSNDNSTEIRVDLEDLEWKSVDGEFKLASRMTHWLLVLLTWAIPLSLTIVFSYILYLFSEVPNKGTVDLVIPDGPLANETHFEQLWDSLRYSGPLFAAYGSMLWALSRKKRLSANNSTCLWGWAIVLFVLSPLVYMGLNCVLDDSEAAVYRVAVMDKYESTDVNSNNPVWRLTLSSWRPGRGQEILVVTKDEFDMARPMESKVIIQIKPGHFGFPWIESYVITNQLN